MKSFIIIAITDEDRIYEDVVEAENEEDAVLKFKKKWSYRDKFTSVQAKPNT